MLALLHSVPPTLQQATGDPRLYWGLLDTHGQVWISLLWGHCFFLLSPGVQKVLFCALQESVSQSCVSSGSSTVGSMAISFKRAYAKPKSVAPRAPAPCGSPLLTRTSTGDTHTQLCLSLCEVLGSWCTQSLFKPSEHFWWE